MTGGIYLFRCGAGRLYVGSSVNFVRRRRDHMSALRAGRHYNHLLQEAWNAGGLEFLPLLVCSRDDLLFFEQRAIDILAPELNLTPLAESTRGYRATAETRARISAVQRNRSAEWRARMSEGQRNRAPASKETRDKLSKAGRGRPHSVEHAAKIAAALRGKPKSAEHRAKLSASAVKRGGKSKKMVRHSKRTPALPTQFTFSFTG